MSLPKGFKRLEYIQSSGTQYVDTKFVPSVSPRIDIDMTVLGNNDVDVFGTATATAPCWILNFDTDNGGVIYYRYYSASYKSYVFASNTPVGRRANYSVGQNLVIDGTACIAMSSYDFSSFKQTVRLFGGRTYAPVRVYSCRIYNGDTLARDFIPCQNASGAVGLWDAENEVFYGNAGTGTFTAGPVVPEIVDESEIAELEYIQSSGAQYVDTLFKPNQNTRVIMDAEYLGGDVLFCSATTGTSGMFGLQYVGGKLYFYYGTLSGTTAGAITTGQKQRFEMNQNAVLLDGVVLKTNSAQSFQCTYSLPVFCINVGGSISYFSSLKLFAFSAYANGLLTRDYIPAMLANGEVGLYDRVFHAFYRNAGTGEFIAGPEAQTVPKAPENFRVDAEDGTLLTLAWDASKKATGYRLYRSGQLLADTEETSISVAVEPFAGAVFTLTAYNENGEGAGAELTYFNAPDDPILFLVTDRTQQDVTERNQKGYYAASDLNRVGFAVKYLAGRLKDSGVSVTVSPVLTWTDEKWATPADMTAYLKDVQTMRDALKVAEATPTAPEDMAKLTYSEANDIEAILVALDVHITRMLSIVDVGWSSGLAYTGFYAKEAY